MINDRRAEEEFEAAVDLLDEDRVAAQRRRVAELRAEAEYHQRRVDSFNATADQIERTWGLAEPPAEPKPASPAFESYAQYTPSVELAPPLDLPMPGGMP